VSDPLIRAFFIGRAAADMVFEGLEESLTDVLSEVGKFESEQREKLRAFTENVIERANQQEVRAAEDLADAVNAAQQPTGATEESGLQEIIDGLRAEVAQLRSELQRYRSSERSS